MTPRAALALLASCPICVLHVRQVITDAWLRGLNLEPSLYAFGRRRVRLTCRGRQQLRCMRESSSDSTQSIRLGTGNRVESPRSFDALDDVVFAHLSSFRNVQ